MSKYRYNWIWFCLGGLCGIIWMVSITQRWGLIINILLGILILLLIFFEGLLYKPIDLVDYKLTNSEAKENEKKIKKTKH